MLLIVIPLSILPAKEICWTYDQDKAEVFPIGPSEAAQILKDDEYILSYRDVEYPIRQFNKSWKEEGRIYKFFESEKGEVLHMISWDIKNPQFRSESWINKKGIGISRDFDETGSLRDIHIKDKSGFHKSLFLTKEGTIERKYITDPQGGKTFSIEYGNDDIPYQKETGGDVEVPCYE